MKFLKKLLIVSVAVVAVSGCKKLDIAPTDRFSDLTFWKVDANVYNALYNNYSLIYNSSLYFDAEAISDNAYSSSGDLNIIASGNATSQTAKFAGDWNAYYSAIKSCNIFLKNINLNTTLPAAIKTRLVAETRFIRAFEHFNLAKWYGDVPIVDHDATPEEAQTISRSPKAAVVKFVLDELNAVVNDLPSKDALPATENGRITKGAALALQARVLLYQGDRMADVVVICEKLMNNQTTYGTYALAPSYSALFSDPTVNKTSNEVILSVQYVPTTRTWQNFWDFAPRTVGGRVSSMSPTQELVDDYIMLNGKDIKETGSGYAENNPYVNRDPRLTATVVYDKYVWVNPNNSTKTIYIKPGTDPVQPGLDEYSAGSQAASPTAYYWRKYFDPSALANFVSGNNLHLFRYAEILLDYAEAKQSLGQMDATVWNKTIGALRARAGFTDAGALNYPVSADMTNIIRRERRVELAMEGLRTDDIRRWKTAGTVMNGYAHGAKFSSDQGTDNGYIRAQLRKFNAQRDYLWAIPAHDVDLNKNLGQNPGYAK
ncbi:RagB/SusD family nutrient uptake outer membrane protein [Mucilaginibacter sabulilitoris]|uniref:RagB/SusD family nutrient uptake outer membrane protein n=1 Tax=Mucilaginibacter sabulilitoris TaxID=1173583 RepID=A0ABZ0TES0_9SPHI|nr:RagB/SusD family nutrient uptake outer membrane protein [Mucilaginibacter sabulilitoris]WPU91676.1 RagB/SusD family nutrient uptake outer membrane protein [Mucilaginibacter sabulilitoris]